MRININIMTGSYFGDGTPEVGKVVEAEVVTRVDLDEVLDEIDEADDYFLTDEDGEEMSIEDINAMLD